MVLCLYSFYYSNLSIKALYENVLNKQYNNVSESLKFYNKVLLALVKNILLY